MHDVICVNLYRKKSWLNPQKTGVTGASPNTYNNAVHWCEVTFLRVHFHFYLDPKSII